MIFILRVVETEKDLGILRVGEVGKHFVENWICLWELRKLFSCNSFAISCNNFCSIMNGRVALSHRRRSFYQTK